MRPNAEGAKKGEAPVSSTKTSTKQNRKGSSTRNKNRSGNKRRKGSQKRRKNAGGVPKLLKASPRRKVANAEVRFANKENKGDRGQLRGQVAAKGQGPRKRKNRRKKNRKGRKKRP